jgi:hypothetical protein
LENFEWEILDARYVKHWEIPEKYYDKGKFEKEKETFAETFFKDEWWKPNKWNKLE